MPKSMHVNVSGIWKRVKTPHVNVSSVWKRINVAYVRVSGAWKKMYEFGLVTLTSAAASAIDAGGATRCEAGFRFNADGTVERFEDNFGGGRNYTQIFSGTDWIDPNSASTTTHYIRATFVSFTENETNPVIFDTRNGALNSWDTLGNGATREWSLVTQSNTAGKGTHQWVLDIEIASDSEGTDILEIGRYTMNGEAG